jgi:hypothetical protein
MTVGGVEIDRKISLGHLLTIGTIVVGIIMGWANLDNRVTANEKATLEAKASSLERDAKQDANIADLTRSYNQMALTLEGIRVDVGYLRRNVEEAKRTAVAQ